MFQLLWYCRSVACTAVTGCVIHSQLYKIYKWQFSPELAWGKAQDLIFSMKNGSKSSRKNPGPWDMWWNWLACLGNRFAQVLQECHLMTLITSYPQRRVKTGSKSKSKRQQRETVSQTLIVDDFAVKDMRSWAVKQTKFFVFPQMWFPTTQK